jgi:ATP-dependent RNA helicase DeaD
MLTFSELGVSSNLMQGIEELGFQIPTGIQEKVIPIIYQTDKDIVGLAQTGTGKTAAFGLPIIDLINQENNKVQTLILAPTRELCVQIAKDLETYAKYKKGIQILAVYGGASIENQIKSLKRGVHIIVATPGRMLDLIKRKAAYLADVRTIVLDEADEMLNMGFKEDLDAILAKTSSEKRSFLFSATMPDELARISKKYMKDAVEITIGKKNAGAENVKHLYYQVSARDRYLALKRIVDFHTDIYGLIFCRTRMETKDVAEKLMKDGYSADTLHGDLSQSQRDYAMKRFRDKNIRILVATDVAARGLDVNDITHVINYNLPDDLEVYTHRSGRTGRADKHGVSISIVNLREKGKLKQLERIISKKIQQDQIPSGAEICKKQLFKLIDRMEHAEVDETQIAPFMEEIYKKLDWMSKEEIVKHFVSLEFNRFLQYYKNAKDLNAIDDSRPGRKEERGSAARFGNKREFSRGDSSRRGKSRGEFSRFFINIGEKDGILPKNIIGMINDNTRDRDINIGEIAIKDSFSFFEVGEEHEAKIIEAFKNAKFENRSLRVEKAEKDVGGRNRKTNSSERKPNVRTHYERKPNKRTDKRKSGKRR